MKTYIPMISLALAACAPPGDDHGHEETEIITTVRLTFAPEDGSAPIHASFTDPDGDGGMSGTTDPVLLFAGVSYALQIDFFNELGGEMEDITREIEEEAEEHQVFVFGDAIAGPAAMDSAAAIAEHTYADFESDYGAQTGDDLPVGLINTFVTRAAGSGELVVALRHLPELNGQPQKVAGLAESLAAGDALPGEIDANVSFELTVQ
jgi:hypothetical protein